MNTDARPGLCGTTAAVALAALCSGAGAQNFTPWVPTWADEFEGTQLDPAKWLAQNIAWPHNNEQQYYSPANARVGNGVLTITAEARPQGGRSYTSARIETDDRFSQLFGRFEARLKLPRTQSLWPAFWLLPQDGTWPPEIDIMELLGHEPNKVYFTNHWGVYPNNQNYGTSFTGPDFSQDFHTFTVDWEPGVLDFYVDGIKRSTHTSQVPSKPMFVILNVAVGGIWPGYPDSTTRLPQYMVAEWVRAYKRLQNRGFEYMGSDGNQTAWGWNRFGNASASTQRPRSGARCGKLFGNFTGSPNSSGLTQDMPASPGQTWRGSGWFYNWTADAMAGANVTTLAIEWRDASGSLLSTSAPTTALDASTPRDSWREVVVQATAPAGTARARLIVRFSQPALAAGAAYFDDMEFVFAPPTCRPDFNGDSTLDFFDYLDFVAAFAEESPSADFNADGTVDFFDYLDFAAALDAGCD
jgi:beta-glucanase (GH16 family)